MLGVSSRLVSRLPRRAFSAVRGGEGTVVALTGASGYIGSHIAALLVEDGYDVRAIVRDASNDAKCAHLRALGARRAGALTLWEGDLLAPGSFDAAFDGAAAVVHTAAHVELGTGEHIVRASLDGVSHLLASPWGGSGGEGAWGHTMVDARTVAQRGPASTSVGSRLSSDAHTPTRPESPDTHLQVGLRDGQRAGDVGRLPRVGPGPRPKGGRRARQGFL